MNRPGGNNNFWNTNINNNWNNININRWGPGWGAGSRWGDGRWNGYGGRYWSRGYPPYYGNWFRGTWAWSGPVWWGTGGAYSAGFLAGSLSDNFYNPYYVVPPYGTPIVYNYAQPVYVDAAPLVVDYGPTDIVPPDAPLAAPTLPMDVPVQSDKVPDVASDPKVREAGVHFDQARDLFKQEKYAAALTAIDQSIQVLPNDAASHEFRALILFAQGQYQEAAATLYSVLAVGPGWSWDTIKALYGNSTTYEKQLDALMAYIKANPNDAASRFVMAYHSLALGEIDSAVKFLNQVVALNPKDQLAAAMANALSQSQQPAEQKPKITP